MALLARRNLFHDRIRFAVTLTGIVFALALITIQFGLFLGFTTTTSNNIDHSGCRTRYGQSLPLGLRVDSYVEIRPAGQRATCAHIWSNDDMI